MVTVGIFTAGSYSDSQFFNASNLFRLVVPPWFDLRGKFWVFRNDVFEDVNLWIYPSSPIYKKELEW